MAKTYYVTPTRARERNRRLAFEGGAETVTFDYTSWAEDNGTVTGVTVTVETGNAAISGEALASNVKTMVITTTNSGRSLIKLAATDGTNTDIQWLEVYAKDINIAYDTDYGMTTA
tara:strand:- start:147 stop:494 length:348 start_codon:yes stop_codon:yes gene_type:complete